MKRKDFVELESIILVYQFSDKESIVTLSSVLAEAFSEKDPLISYLFPHKTTKLAKTRAMFHYILTLGAAEGTLFKTERGEGVVVAYESCSSYNAILPQIRCGIIKTIFSMGISNAVRALLYDEFAQKIHKQVMDTPHIYLNSVAVSPKFQGEGYGGKLINHLITLSEEKKLPLYLETSCRENIGFYEHLGFRVVDEYVVPRSDVFMWPMVRDCFS